ncbi:hypothetical protein GCM10010869_59010 [Mesorhizobium tianshanense]|uniref:Uncharacterized protein n=1 Tax=Mesorhizobium tianshanense TaxID=39844 RepID=A0A562N3V3_9HYPH|nr:hypothetical protein IQ26_05813 [Mesorhizobium tianshanense]GLS40304.1 hypothetical protein GCM10010869_59010 [Mesorhizobium tianshanense]
MNAHRSNAERLLNRLGRLWMGPAKTGDEGLRLALAEWRMRPELLTLRRPAGALGQLRIGRRSMKISRVNALLKKRCHGLVAPWIVNAPINAAIFQRYVETQLAPELAPGDVVFSAEADGGAIFQLFSR